MKKKIAMHFEDRVYCYGNYCFERPILEPYHLKPIFRGKQIFISPGEEKTEELEITPVNLFVKTMPFMVGVNDGIVDLISSIAGNIASFLKGMSFRYPFIYDRNPQEIHTATEEQRRDLLDVLSEVFKKPTVNRLNEIEYNLSGREEAIFLTTSTAFYRYYNPLKDNTQIKEFVQDPSFIDEFIHQYNEKGHILDVVFYTSSTYAKKNQGLYMLLITAKGSYHFFSITKDNQIYQLTLGVDKAFKASLVSNLLFGELNLRKLREAIKFLKESDKIIRLWFDPQKEEYVLTSESPERRLNLLFSCTSTQLFDSLSSYIKSPFGIYSVKDFDNIITLTTLVSILQQPELVVPIQSLMSSFKLYLNNLSKKSPLKINLKDYKLKNGKVKMNLTFYLEPAIKETSGRNKIKMPMKDSFIYLV